MFAPAEVVVQELVFDRGGALEGDLEAMIAVVDVGDVALLGDFHALLVREFHEAPEEHARTGGFVAMETVGSTLLGRVLDIEPGLAAESLDRLINQSTRLGSILLRDWNRLRRGRPSRWCRGLGGATDVQD